MATNPTIQERIFYFDAEGDAEGQIDVADSRLFRQAVVQRAQLLNLSTTGRGLPSILPEYNRINVEYPRSHSITIQQNNNFYDVAVAGPLAVREIMAEPLDGSFQPLRVDLHDNHGLHFFPPLQIQIGRDGVNPVPGFRWTQGSNTMSFDDDILPPSSIANLETMIVIYFNSSVNEYHYARVTAHTGNNLTLSSGAPEAANLGGWIIIARPIKEALDGAFIGAGDEQGDPFNVNSGSDIDTGGTTLGVDGNTKLPDNTFVTLDESSLYAFNFTNTRLIGAPNEKKPTLVQTPLFIEDAVSVMNSRLQTRYGPSAPQVSVVNNQIVGPTGSTVTDHTRLTRSTAIVTVPDFYYDNNFNILGASIGSEMNRLFVPGTTETGFTNTITLNGQPLLIKPGKYASPEGFAQHLSSVMGSDYTIKVLRTSSFIESNYAGAITGSSSYVAGVRSAEIERLDESLDTLPTFRLRGTRADDTSTLTPYRPFAYQIKMEGPAHHQLNVSTTSSYIRTILGLSPGSYGFDVSGSVQRDSRTRGTCSVSILQAPKRFNIALQNNSFKMDAAVRLNIGTETVVLTTKSTANAVACGLSAGEVVNVRFGTNAAVARGMVHATLGDEQLTDFVFSISMAAADFATLESGVNDGFSGEFTITRVGGNRAKLDVTGYPLPHLMSPAPLVGLTPVTIIDGSTLLPRPFSAFSPSYIIRLVADADGHEPRSNPLPITVTEGEQVTDMPFGYVRGGTSWLGGSINLPLTLITPTRLAHMKVLVVFPDKTPVDLRDEYFTGAVSVAGQDRLAHFAVHDKKIHS